MAISTLVLIFALAFVGTGEASTLPAKMWVMPQGNLIFNMEHFISEVSILLETETEPNAMAFKDICERSCSINVSIFRTISPQSILICLLSTVLQMLPQTVCLRNSSICATLIASRPGQSTLKTY